MHQEMMLKVFLNKTIYFFKIKRINSKQSLLLKVKFSILGF